MKSSLLFAALFAGFVLSGCAQTGTPVREAAWTFSQRTDASGNTGMRSHVVRETDASGIQVQRLHIALRGRELVYRMPQDPDNPLVPLSSAPRWLPYSPLFVIEGLNGASSAGEWLMDWQPADAATVRQSGLLLSSRLDAWGVVDDGAGEVAVMIWAEPGGSPVATLLIRDIPEIDWLAFALYPVVSNAVGSTLAFENIPYTYHPSKGTLRRDAVANADGDFTYLRGEGLHWELDAVRFWALTHNLGSQQTRGGCSAFHPDDFSVLHVDRGRGGLRAEIRPGVDCARFALGDFSGVPWTDALEAKRPQFPAVLAFLERGDAAAHYRPVAVDRERRRRIQMLMAEPAVATAEAEALQGATAFLKAFSEAESQGVALDGLQTWFHLVNHAAEVETALSRHLLAARLTKEM